MGKVDHTEDWKTVIAKVENPIGRDWHDQAMQHGKLHGSFIEIKPGSEQHEAWLVYFSRLAWTPAVVSQVSRGICKSWTAPCEWPWQMTGEDPDRYRGWIVMNGSRNGVEYLKVEYSKEARCEHIAQLRARGKLTFGGGNG